MPKRAAWYGVVCASLIIAVFTLAVVGSLVGERPSRPFDLQIKPVSVVSLPGWWESDPGPTLAVFLRSCARFEARPGDRPLDPQIKGGLLERLYGLARDWQLVCARA